MTGSLFASYDPATPAFAAWFSLGSPALVETAMRAGGCDIAVLDFQHGLWDRQSAYHAAGLAAAPVLVRVVSTEEADISFGLDTGASGIIVPMVDTPEMAERAVAAAHFPPKGIRSGGGVRPLGQGFGRYFAAHDPKVGIMIETHAAIEAVEAIAAVNGVDFLFIGPGDLAISLGCFPDVDDRLERAIETTLAASGRAGLPCGIFTSTPEEAQRRIAQGFSLTVLGDDVGVVSRGFRSPEIDTTCREDK